MEKQVYQLDVEQLKQHLKTDLENGLSTEEVLERQTQFGFNQLDEAKRKSYFVRFIEQLKDFMILVLFGAAILSFVSGEWKEGILVIAIVLVNAFLGIIQEAKAERALESIKALSSPHATVLRNGIETTIDVKELVVGDVVILEAGDFVPADVRIIESINLKADESALTGEAVPVEKTAKVLTGENIALGDRLNLGFMSTVITYGRGKAVVVSIGMQTEIGKIATMLSETEESTTPLQKSISQLGKYLAIIALGIVFVIFAITLVEAYLIDGVVTFEEISSALLTSIALAVAAIPEGLPAIITIVLALGMQNLVKQRAIIRTLPAVETLGSTSIICSDKTGTLTQNVMTVKSFYLADGEYAVDDVNTVDSSAKKLVHYGVLCNDTKVRKENDAFIKIGDPTEIAFIDFAIAVGENPINIASQRKRVYELPFDSERKLMTTVHDFADGRYAVIKGAPDVLFARAQSVDGNKNTKAALVAFEQQNNEMADRALRVLAVAYKKIDASLPFEALTHAYLENDVTLLGLVGMIDPPRPEAKPAIELCVKAGIKTIMITGDHKNTAVAIATDLGILGADDLAITGKELDALLDEEFSEKLSSIRVYARVSPENKVRIVKAWRSTGRVVAMTGDGVNDAPSIKQADIGIAMGISGTEVAKGAADMVLTDDNFATIVDAVGEGRAIFANIKKAIHFLLSCNIGEIITIFLGTTIGFLLFGARVTTLTAVQILWVNLVTDSLMAIGLGLEPKEDNIMDEPPRDSRKSIFSDGMGVRIIWQGLMLGLLSFSAYYIGWHYAPDGVDQMISAQTLTFMVLAISQLVHAFNVRSNLSSTFKLKKNKFLLYALAISLGLQLIVVITPFGRNIFGIALPTLGQWVTIITLVFIPLLVVELIKFILRLKAKSAS